MTLVAPLQGLDSKSLPRAGGKAANLGEMLRAGLPVPPGFALTTEAYQQFVAANNLQSEIERLARTARADDTEPRESASQAIGRLFTAGAMPKAIETAVSSAYAQMGRPPVAVRSSATAEDLAEA